MTIKAGVVKAKPYICGGGRYMRLAKRRRNAASAKAITIINAIQSVIQPINDWRKYTAM
jgi:hypothetical protein